MVLTCRQCRRLNPADAQFCYFDGIVLGGKEGNGAPLDLAGMAFPAPFVFPSGQSCRNFDQLALGCHHNWIEAQKFLKEGLFEKFLGGLGRVDLAMAARSAASFPDPERGLDQLLGKFPSKALTAPQLQVDPPQIQLGPVKVGKDLTFNLRLCNHGMRLLIGSVVSDCLWLCPDKPGLSQKLFQVCSNASIPVVIQGKHLRAGKKPIEGQLTIESNGGTATVRVCIEVTVQPFPEGILAGAISPRQVAEKAMKAPKEAAVYFQSGAVAAWYEKNGWTYPVAGPLTPNPSLPGGEGRGISGLGAVQQYFEALGLTKPPKVEISETALKLKAPAGGKSSHLLRVRTSENRPVYAYAQCDQPWLTIGPVQLQGNQATLPLEIKEVPDRPGEVLRAKVTVTANGQQRFVVPVSLSVDRTTSIRKKEKSAALAGSLAVATVPAGTPPLADSPWGSLDSQGDPSEQILTRRRKRSGPMGIHLLPAVLLGLVLFALVGRDWWTEPPGPKVTVRDEPEEKKSSRTAGPVYFAEIKDEPEEGVPLAVGPVKVDIREDPQPEVPPVPKAPIHPEPWVGYRYGIGMRFGIFTTPAAKGGGKNLTFKFPQQITTTGQTNDTLLRINGKVYEFGGGGKFGSWLAQNQTLKDPDKLGSESIWTSGPDPDTGVRVTQILEIIPSQQPVIVNGNPRRLLDTVLVRYRIENKDPQAHKVGIRVLIDTYMGSNDGVPFTVPGLPGLVTSGDFQSPQIRKGSHGPVPDFIQALEYPNLRNPGTVARMTFRLGPPLAPPNRVLLTYWPEAKKTTWDLPVFDIRNDSCVVMQWDEKNMPSGGNWDIGFAYGLGDLTSSEPSGKLAVTLGGSFEPGQTFSVTALVDNPAQGQTLTLEIPEGLERVQGSETQDVGREATSLVTWKVKVLRTGEFRINVRSSTGVSQAKTIAISRPEILGGHFRLALEGKDFSPLKVFQVSAYVDKPVPGQTLELELPAGINCLEDGKAPWLKKVPPPVKEKSLVQWNVTVLQEGKFPIAVQSSNGIRQKKILTVEAPREGTFDFELLGNIQPGKEFTVQAKVSKRVKDQKLTLVLPEGMKLARGKTEQLVPSPKNGDVSWVAWSVVIEKGTRFPIRVQSSTGVTRAKTITLKETKDGKNVFN